MRHASGRKRSRPLLLLLGLPALSALSAMPMLSATRVLPVAPVLSALPVLSLSLAGLSISALSAPAAAQDHPAAASPGPGGTAPPREQGGIAKKASDLVAERMMRHITALSAPEMGGRAPGSAALEKCAKYIADELNTAGVKPAGDGGGWFQVFTPAPGDYPVPAAAGQKWGQFTLENVVGILPGSGGPSARAVVIGAHYDHLGMVNDKLHPGADDNASGVAVLLELANQIVSQGPVRNTFIFVAFSGEEEGTLGSRFYTEHPAVPLDRCLAMLNLDTVGRMDDKKLYIFGSSSAAEFPEILKGINLGQALDLVTPASAPFASDQIAFYEKGIPVLHFFTGPNPDYHNPGDTADKINPDGLLNVLNFVQETALFLAEREKPLTFLPPGAASAPPQTASGPPRRVSLGTIPDFSRESGGVLISGVMPGSPAEKAGLAKGDILVGLDKTPIDNLADYSAALKSHQPGDTVEVVIKRGGEELRRRVQLVERK